MKIAFVTTQRTHRSMHVPDLSRWAPEKHAYSEFDLESGYYWHERAVSSVHSGQARRD